MSTIFRTFDPEGRILTELHPDGVAHTVIETSDVSPAESEVRYSFFQGLPGAEQVVVTSTYDSASALTSERRIITRTRSDGASQIVTAEAGRPGSVEVTTQANGAVTTTTFDNQGRKVLEVKGSGQSTSYKYDESGGKEETDNKGSVFHYSPAGSLCRIDYSHGGSHLFDGDFNCICEIDRKDKVTSHTYDPYGRLASTTHPDGEVEEFSYDGVGKRLLSTREISGLRRSAFWIPAGAFYFAAAFVAAKILPPPHGPLIDQALEPLRVAPALALPASLFGSLVLWWYWGKEGTVVAAIRGSRAAQLVPWLSKLVSDTPRRAQTEAESEEEVAA